MRSRFFQSFRVKGIVASLVAIVVLCPSAAAAEWDLPVDAVVVDGFRPPQTRFGRGNRGLEYGDSQGLDVVAVDTGRVIFAGQVGRARYVVVDHGSGLWSTYAWLQSIAVVRGQAVRQGQVVGIAAAGFHLTARLNEVYVDPALLLAGATVIVQLEAADRLLATTSRIRETAARPPSWGQKVGAVPSSRKLWSPLGSTQR